VVALAVEQPVLNRLGDVGVGHPVALGEVGDGARNAQHLGPCARAQAEGVGPYSQAYLMIGGGDVIGYTDYEFECTADFLSGLLAAGRCKKMVVEAWHGAFVFGRDAGEAFFRSFYLDQACAVQLQVQEAAAGGATIRTIPEAEQRRHLADMAVSEWYGYEGELEWAAIRQRLDQEAPHHRS